MERVEIEVLSEDTNYAVVRMPGRQFPGSVIQGQNLMQLFDAAKLVHTLALETDNRKLISAAFGLLEEIEFRLNHFGEVIKADKA